MEEQEEGERIDFFVQGKEKEEEEEGRGIDFLVEGEKAKEEKEKEGRRTDFLVGG